MDTNASARRLFPLPAASDTTLQTPGDSPGPQYRRHSSASESGSSSDGGAVHRAQRAQQATHGFAAPRATFGVENPAFNAAQRLQNDSATIIVDDPPYIPPGSSHSSQNVQFSQTQANAQFSTDFFDHHARPPPSVTQQLEPDRQHSVQSSPTGSAHSQSSDRSGHLSGQSQRSASSGTSNHGSQHSAQNMQMEEPYRVQQPANPAVTFNQERYPAFDASGERRVGLEHIRYDMMPHQGSGQPYYLPRTHTYPELCQGPRVLNYSLNPPAPVGLPYTRQDGTPVALPPATPQLELETRVPTRRGRAALVASPEPLPQRDSESHSPAQGSPSLPSDVPDPEPELRKALGLAPDADVSLWTLSDPPPGEKPNYSYPILIKLAIHGSPRKRLTLQEIYGALEDRFEWFMQNTHDKAWKNSIRHNLSLNKTFRKVTKPITEPGKGSYWIIDYSNGEGNKRVRKRNKRPTKAELVKRAQEAAGQEESSSSDDDDAAGGAQSSLGASQTPAPTSQSRRSEDVNIDPELRNQGHVVGHGRVRSVGPVTRSIARRAHSPYTTAPSPGPSQSRVATPAASQLPAPQLMPQTPMSAHERAQRQVAFSQYAFGQIPFAPTPGPFGQTAFGQPSGVPARSSWGQPPAQAQTPVPASPAPSMVIPPVARSTRSTRSANAANRQDLEIRNAPIRHPTPRPGIQHVRDPSGLVVARRIDSGNAGIAPGTVFPQQQQFGQGMPPRSGGPSQDSRRDRSSSGSSRE